jgi:DNA-binding SARP family transcriptional activator
MTDDSRPAAGPVLHVLGGMSARIDGRAVDLGGPRQRAVLGLLLVARGQVVSAQHIAEEIWGDRTPANPMGVLQSYISHLRRALQPGSAARARSGVLISAGRGYACRLPADAVDAWRFEDLVREAVALGEDAAALTLLRAALQLWQGRPYADHASQPWADAEANRLEGIRALAVEQLAAARLAAGESATLVPELEALVQADPLREDRWRLLAVALYRAGRQADALAALRRARTRLVEDLGVLPGPALQLVESQILAQDPALTPRQHWRPPPTGPAGHSDRPATAEQPPGPVRPAPPAFVSALPGAPAADPVPGGPDGAPAGDPMIDRRSELEVLARAVDDAVAGTGGLALIEGPAGIGKSRLLAETRRTAVQRGARVLSGRGSLLERELAFGVVRQLMEPLVSDPAERDRLLVGAAAAAAGVFDVTGAQNSGDASFAILHGLYWLVVRAAERRPLVLLVDDLHWCDAGTLRFLAYLVRRVPDLPVLVLATRRTGEEHADEAALVDLAHAPDAVLVEPAPLSAAGVTAIIRERLGEPDEPFVAACRRTTGGNPLLLRQLLRALESERVAPDAAHADTVNAIGSRAVSSVVLRRLAALGPEVGEVARAVAVLGDGCSLELVATLAGLSEDQGAHTVARAAQAEILRDDYPLGFVHPVVRDAVYDGMPAVRRGLAHRRAARLLADRSADPELVAAHLLRVPARGDGWVVDALLTAAERATDRGAPDSAASYLRRATDEPPPAEQRAAVLARLGLVEAVSDGVAAAGHLRDAYRELPPGPLTTEVAFAAAVTMVFTGPPGAATAFAFEAADRVPADRVDDRQRLEAVGRAGGYMHGLDPVQWADRQVSVQGDGVGARMLAGYLAWEDLMAVRHHEDPVRLARFALEGTTLLDVDSGLFWVTASLVLSCADVDLTEFWNDLRARAHARGSLFAAMSTNVWHAHDQWWHGDLRDAERLLRIANQQALEWGAPVVASSYIETFLIQVLLERGDLAGARALLDAVAANPRIGEGIRLFSEAQAMVLIAEGRAEQALAPAGVVEQEMPHLQNPAYRPWRSLRARALARLGRTGEAVQLVTDELELARRWGAPRLIGRTLRIRGELRGPDGRDDLAEAVEVLDGTTAPSESARSLLALASFEAPQATVRQLTRGYELAASCGADGVRQACADRLAALGASPPPPPAGLNRLPTVQRQAVWLWGTGLEVTEIAERLLVTPGAVKEMLGTARRELQVADEGQLRALVTPGRAS